MEPGAGAGTPVTPWSWPAPDAARRIEPAPPEPRRYATPTGACCLRSMRVDGTVAGSGDCEACGTCLLIAETAWGP